MPAISIMRVAFGAGLPSQPHDWAMSDNRYNLSAALAEEEFIAALLAPLPQGGGASDSSDG
jgi:hypothetical protein